MTRPCNLQPHPIGCSACLSCIPSQSLPPSSPIPASPLVLCYSIRSDWCLSFDTGGFICFHSSRRPKEVRHLYRESRPTAAHSQHRGASRQGKQSHACLLKASNSGGAVGLFGHCHCRPTQSCHHTGRNNRDERLILREILHTRCSKSQFRLCFMSSITDEAVAEKGILLPPRGHLWYRSKRSLLYSFTTKTTSNLWLCSVCKLELVEQHTVLSSRSFQP